MWPLSGTPVRIPRLLLLWTDFHPRRHRPMMRPIGGSNQLMTHVHPASRWNLATRELTCCSRSTREPELSRTWSEYSSFEPRGSWELRRARAAVWVLLSLRMRRCSWMSFELSKVRFHEHKRALGMKIDNMWTHQYTTTTLEHHFQSPASIRRGTSRTQTLWPASQYLATSQINSLVTAG